MVNASYILISVLIPAVFVVLLETSIFLKAFNVAFSSFEQLKSLLAMLEAIFGVYLGMVLSSMFTVEKDNEKA